MCVRRNVTETIQRIPQIALDDDPALADGEAVVLTPQRGNVFLQEGKCFEGILNRKKSETRNKRTTHKNQNQRDLGLQRLRAEDLVHAMRDDKAHHGKVAMLATCTWVNRDEKRHTALHLHVDRVVKHALEVDEAEALVVVADSDATELGVDQVLLCEIDLVIFLHGSWITEKNSNDT